MSRAFEINVSPGILVLFSTLKTHLTTGMFIPANFYTNYMYHFPKCFQLSINAHLAQSGVGTRGRLNKR